MIFFFWIKKLKGDNELLFMEFRVGDSLSILYKHDTLSTSEPHSVYNTTLFPWK